MRKLEFLAGTWEGESTVTQGQGRTIKITQTEQVQFKLDGLVLSIEGTGRDQTGKTVYSALGIVSFDQKANRYVIRAWNSGNFVETEMKVASNGFEWGFQSGPLTMISRMTIDEKGRWSETSEGVLTGGRKVHNVELLLTRK